MIFDQKTSLGLAKLGSRRVLIDESRPGFCLKVSFLGRAAFSYRYMVGTWKREVPLGREFAQALALYEKLSSNTGKLPSVHEVVSGDNVLFSEGHNLLSVLREYHVQHVQQRYSSHSWQIYEGFHNSLLGYCENKAPAFTTGVIDTYRARLVIRDFLAACLT